MATSRTMYKYFLSSKHPNILMMLGWFKYIWIFTSLMNWSTISSSIRVAFSMILRAQTKPLFFYWAKKTLPYLPLPTFFIKRKLSKVIVLFVLANWLGIKL